MCAGEGHLITTQRRATAGSHEEGATSVGRGHQSCNGWGPPHSGHLYPLHHRCGHGLHVLGASAQSHVHLSDRSWQHLDPGDALCGQWESPGCATVYELHSPPREMVCAHHEG